MVKDFLLKLKELPRLKLLIILFTIWQYFSVAGMALLVGRLFGLAEFGLAYRFYSALPGL